MSKVFFISDLHLGHRTILKYSREYREGNTIDEHDEWIVDICNAKLRKCDVLWILGDIAFDRDKLCYLDRIRGQKKLILGNHDRWPASEYMKYGRVYPGLVRRKGFWLSHAPIHPQELRGLRNIHGHVHSSAVPDDRYFNVSVESYNSPMCVDELLSQ